MQHLEVSGVVRHIYIYVIRRLKVNVSEMCDYIKKNCCLELSQILWNFFLLIADVDLYKCIKILLIWLRRDRTGAELPNQGLTSSCLLLLLYLGCITNQSSIPFEYISFYLLVQGHKGPILCFLELYGRSTWRSRRYHNSWCTTYTLGGHFLLTCLWDLSVSFVQPLSGKKAKFLLFKMICCSAILSGCLNHKTSY